MGALLLLSVLLVLGLGASVTAAGLWLSSPYPATVGPPPAGLPGAEPVQIPSASGSLLRGWWVPGTRPGRGAVILMHGIRANRLRLIRRAQVLHDQGFAVLLFDFQGHGESPGRHITFGRLEALDAAAALVSVRDRMPGGRVGAIGISLGAAAALLGPAALRVDALVLESLFPHIDAALANRLRTRLGPVVGPLFTPLLVSVFKRLLPSVLGVRPDELRPIDQIGAVVAPLLLACGTTDSHTPLHEAQALFQRAPGPKLLWAVLGAGHVDLERHDPGQYWPVVLPFLIRTLQRSDGGTL